MAGDITSGSYFEGTPETNADYYSLVHSDGGGSSSRPKEYVVAVGQQVFRCTAWGLKPNTVHKAYLLTTDVSGDCAPIVVITSNTAASNVAANTTPTNTNNPDYGYHGPSYGSSNTGFNYSSSGSVSGSSYQSGKTTRRQGSGSTLPNSAGYSGNTQNNSQTTKTYSYGTELVSTADGKLVFDYRFVPQNAPYPTRTVYGSNTKVSIIPFGQQAFKVTSADGSSKAASFIMSKQTT